MKPMAESAEVFAAYAGIDANLFTIGEIAKLVSKPISPIEAMVDRQTGFDPTFIQAEGIAECLREVIRLKKIVEADSSGEEAFLLQITTLFPSLKK